MSKKQTRKSATTRSTERSRHDAGVDTILAPIDSSEQSREAGRLAVRLATALNASLELMYLEITERASRKTLVIDRAGIDDVDDAVLADLSAKLLGRYSADALSDYEHIEERIRPASRSIVDAICTQAEEAQADLIVMGAHRHSALDKLLRGSMIDRVLKRAPCPVTVVA